VNKTRKCAICHRGLWLQIPICCGAEVTKYQDGAVALSHASNESGRCSAPLNIGPLDDVRHEWLQIPICSGAEVTKCQDGAAALSRSSNEPGAAPPHWTSAR